MDSLEEKKKNLKDKDAKIDALEMDNAQLLGKNTKLNMNLAQLEKNLKESYEREQI